MYERAWNLSEAALSAWVELQLLCEGYQPDTHLLTVAEQEAKLYLKAVRRNSSVQSIGVLDAARRTFGKPVLTQDEAHRLLYEYATILGRIYWYWEQYQGTEQARRLATFLEELFHLCQREDRERLWMNRWKLR